MKVLIIKTSSLGDILHTLPALTDAAAAINGIRFDWIAEEGFQEIPTWHPAVNKVIPVGLRRWRKNILKTIWSGEWSVFKHQLRSEKYHCVIDAQGLIKSALLTRYVTAPVHGFDKKSIREPVASYAYSHRHNVSKKQHAIERTRQLFAASLKYSAP
ncbi:MAG: lipopolysaccharide heptosyltransferase I, partial [Endozoicomonadaceae bacterium]|nr:lipopolysaccharide heptosyltransferase I [Endozoicomonadaceae bacterium]